MRIKFYRLLGCFFVLSILISQPLKGQSNENAVIEEILSLFDRYDIVHIGERHWNITDFNFRVALVNHPRFAEVVDDIVVESGNYLYQGLLDRYMLDLEDLPEEELSQVWRNTIFTNGVWDATIYKEFFHAVREVNENLPPEKRIRVIAAEPSIDWSKVKTREDLQSLQCRAIHAPEVINSEVLKKDRKALIIYGGAHFYRSGGMFNPPPRMLVNLENLMTGKLFSILPISGEDEFSHTFQKMAGVNKLPFFLQVQGSELSSKPGNLFFADAESSLGEFTDGILFFGTKPDSIAEYDPVAADDVEYQQELKRRQLFEAQCLQMMEP